MAYPDFLGIGAQKAGTTWLYESLRANPGVWLPPKKEIHYFSRKRGTDQSLRDKLFGKEHDDRAWRQRVSERLGDYRRELRPSRRGARRRKVKGEVGLSTIPWDLRFFLGRPSDRWYASLFEAGRGKVTGEISPGYARMEPAEVAEVHRLLPDAGILFLIRNPIERAWSAAVMRSVEFGFFEPEPENWVEHFERDASRRHSAYERTLEVWTEHYPESRMFVGFFEDIHFRPQELLARIFAFLGAPSPPPREEPERRVYPGVESTMPRAMARHLATMYRHEVAALSDRFGGHASWWAYTAERILAEPEDGPAIPYPFYDSPYRRDWLELGNAEEPPPLQSDVLADLVQPAALER